jgi:hypothetical protein
MVDACRVAAPGTGRAGVEHAMDGVDMWHSVDVARKPLGHTLLCHACSMLQEADDNKDGKNGVYTAALLKVRQGVGCGQLWLTASTEAQRC